MKILLTGAHGQVGSSLASLAVSRGIEVVAYGRDTLNVCDIQAVRAAVHDIKPQLVVNAAAYTAVDNAEGHPEAAFLVNRDGPAHLASTCAEFGLPMIHLSTDFVFDGCSRDGYAETHKISPLGVYGKSKWQGEQEVEHRLKRHLILRVSWVFSSRANNFVRTILRKAQEHEELRVVCDQRGCPTAAFDIATTVLRLASKMEHHRDVRWGTYHFCGTPATTWFEFAKAIVAEAQRYSSLAVRRIVPVSSDEFPTRAPRPANSVLVCDRLGSEFGIVPSPWRPALQRVLKEIYGD